MDLSKPILTLEDAALSYHIRASNARTQALEKRQKLIKMTDRQERHELTLGIEGLTRSAMEYEQAASNYEDAIRVLKAHHDSLAEFGNIVKKA